MNDSTHATRTPRPMRGRRATLRARAAAATVVVLLAGCASGGAGSEPLQWDATLDLGVPGELIDVVPQVQYYPACGNEVLERAGQLWYPFSPANLDEYPAQPVAMADRSPGLTRASAPVAMEAVPAAATVVEPGPGDDTGTLTRYEGGFAHWSSESGGLETWLTETELEYSWVC